MRYALTVIVILLTTITIQAQLVRHADPCDKATIAYRMPTENSDAKECIAFVTVGYEHGIEVGQTGQVQFNRIRGRHLRSATLEVLDTDAYLSTCRISGLTADEDLKRYKVRLDCRDWSAAECLEKAERAFAAEDWAEAQYFYSVCKDSLPSDQALMVCDHADQCSQHLREERFGKLSTEEAESELAKRGLYWDLAVHYLLQCDYRAAKEYTDRILRVARDDQPALEMRDLIAMNAGAVLAREEANRYSACDPKNAPDDNRELDTVDVYPEMISQVTPTYPPGAAASGTHGDLWVQSLVSARGKVLQSMVRESSGSVALDYAAVKASYGNTFKPAEANGKPVPVWITYKVQFRIRH